MFLSVEKDEVLSEYCDTADKSHHVLWITEDLEVHVTYRDKAVFYHDKARFSSSIGAACKVDALLRVVRATRVYVEKYGKTEFIRKLSRCY